MYDHGTSVFSAHQSELSRERLGPHPLQEPGATPLQLIESSHLETELRRSTLHTQNFLGSMKWLHDVP